MLQCTSVRQPHLPIHHELDRAPTKTARDVRYIITMGPHIQVPGIDQTNSTVLFFPFSFLFTFL